jgi:probable HAF family extracellular repeat protein
LAATPPPEGINDNGVIVGFFLDTDGNQHGFVLNDGTFTEPVDPPGSTSAGTRIESITAAGGIAGTFIDSTGSATALPRVASGERHARSRTNQCSVTAR